LRITNKKDIIPTVPRMLGFKHVGERVLLDAGGITTEDDQNVFKEADPTAVVDSSISPAWGSQNLDRPVAAAEVPAQVEGGGGRG